MATRYAASTILLRQNRGSVETLMIKRNDAMKFGGVWSFPGGVIDKGDGFSLERFKNEKNWFDEDVIDIAAKAAKREMEEECGLSVVFESCDYYSHWLPPIYIPTKFATWFFLSRRASGDMVMNIDESQDIRWINPREALEENKADEKKFPIVVPTYVTLDDLSRHDSVDSVFEDMKNQGPRTYHSWLLQDKENKQKYLCWEGDSLYGKDFADECERKNRAAINAKLRVARRELSI